MPRQFGVVDGGPPRADQSNSRSGSLVTVSLLFAAAIQLAAIILLILVDRETFGLGWYWLAAYVILAAVILVYAAVSGARARFKLCLVAGTLLASVDPIARLSERIAYLDWVPVFGRLGVLHDYAILGSEPAGYVLIFLALFLSMIEVFRARDQLAYRNTLLRERIEAQETLAATGDRLVSIFNSVPDYLFGLDLRGTITFTNPTFPASSPDSVVGRGILDFTHRDDRDIVLDAVRRAQETKQTVSYEVRGIGRESFVPYSCRMGPVISGSDVTGFTVIARDVSEAKAAEATRKRAEERYRFLAETISDVIWKADGRGIIQFISPSCEKQMGYAVEDIVGQKVTAVFVEKQARKDFWLSLERARQHGLDQFQVTGTHHRKDGSEYWAETFVTVVRGAEGNIEGLYGVTRDASSRKELEVKLQKSEEDLRSVVENVADYVAVLDPAGRILDINKAPEGLTREDMIGRDCSEFAVAGEQDRFKELIRRVAGTGIAEHFEIRGVGPNGAIAPYQGRIAAVMQNGAVVRLVIGASDVSEIVSAQEATREAERKYGLLAENSADMIWACDADAVLTYVSPSCFAVLGFSSEEMVGQKLGRNFLREEDRADALRRVDKSRRGEEDESYLQIEVVRKDGTRRWLESNSRVIRNEDGSLAYVQGCSRDITERKRMEEALRAAERKYRLLAENSMDVIWTADTAGRLTYVSPSSFAVNSHRTEEWIGRYLGEDISGQDDRDEVRRHLEEVQRNERDESFTQVEMRRKDGTRYWSETHAHVVRNDDGSFAFIQGCSRDITDRKRIEMELREAKDLYQLLAQNASDVIWLLGPDGRFRYMSPSAFQLSGYTPGEWLTIGQGAPIRNEDVRQQVQSEFAEMAAGTRDQGRYEAELVRKDGAPVWVETMASAVRDGRGALLYVMGSTRDVTARHRSWEVLHAIVAGTSRATGEAFFPALAENLAKALGVRCAFIAALRDGPEEFADTLAFWDSGAFGNNFGYALKGTPCADLTGKHTRVYSSAIRAEFPDNRILADMNAESYGGIQLFASDGVPLGILAVVGERPFESPELVESVLSIFAGRASAELERLRAEKERLRLEEQVRHAQKLESLGVLAGGIAHDFNNLLVGVLGNAGLIKEGMSPDSDDYECVREIESAALRASELTNQMLAYAGKARFVIQPLDLSAVVKEILGLLKASVSKKAVLQFEFAPDLPRVDADPTQIRQVIMNLITNASEALEDREGIVTIRTGVVYLDKEALAQSHLRDELAAGEYVFLEISDSGAGMGPDVQSRIFDPFFTTKFAGRGLGLAAVLGVVRGHKGTLQIESHVGRGTTFRVFLPPSNREADGDAPSETVAAGSTDSRGRILVVDDEPIVRGLAVKVLEKGGFATRIAEDGQMAMEILATAPPEEFAGVLLDLLMPRMGGEETLYAIRSLYPDLPVVLSSGFTEHDVLERFNGTRVDGFLQKPYRASTLLQIMIQACSRRVVLK